MNIPPVRLLVRARLFNQLTAKVKLASHHYDPARFHAAFNGISNRRLDICQRFVEGRSDLTTFLKQADHLAGLCVLLINPRQHGCTASRQMNSLTPQYACAYRDTLEMAKSRASGHAEGRAALQQLEVLLAPSAQRFQDRQRLAAAFWSGHLGDYASFSTQVKKQCIREVPRCGPMSLRQAKRQKASKDILYFIAQQRPADPSTRWTPVEKESVLSGFASRMLAQQHIAAAGSPPASPLTPPAWAATYPPSCTGTTGRTDSAVWSADGSIAFGHLNDPAPEFRLNRADDSDNWSDGESGTGYGMSLPRCRWASADRPPIQTTSDC